MGESKCAYRCGGKALGVKRPLGRSRRRLEDNNEMDIKYIVFKCVDWVDLAQDRGNGASFREYGDGFYIHGSVHLSSISSSNSSTTAEGSVWFYQCQML
jgi:hypothetical protein